MRALAVLIHRRNMPASFHGQVERKPVGQDQSQHESKAAPAAFLFTTAAVCFGAHGCVTPHAAFVSRAGTR
jgi:hypothetical protein